MQPRLAPVLRGVCGAQPSAHIHAGGRCAACCACPVPRLTPADAGLRLQLCELRQPVGRTCSGCGVAFGQYACLACRFYDDDISKRQFQ